MSPHVAKVQWYAIAWATRHGFLPTARDRATFARARFAHLMARAYPDASHTDLCLAVAWLTFTFMLDDRLETTLGRAPESQRLLAGQLLEYLTAGRDDVPRWPLLGRPLAGALADVWARTRARTDRQWQDRFVDHVEEYLAANAWEADNRSRGRVPPVAEYLRMRRNSSATAMFFDLIEVLGTPRARSDESALCCLRAHADNVVAWFNDLVSWPKEVAGGDPHNFVQVVRHEFRVSLAEAVRRVAARHDDEVRAFLACRQGLDPGLLTQPAVRGIVDGLTYWMRANVDWSRESGRYAQPEAV